MQTMNIYRMQRPNWFCKQPRPPVNQRFVWCLFILSWGYKICSFSAYGRVCAYKEFVIIIVKRVEKGTFLTFFAIFQGQKKGEKINKQTKQHYPFTSRRSRTFRCRSFGWPIFDVMLWLQFKESVSQFFFLFYTFTRLGKFFRGLAVVYLVTS